MTSVFILSRCTDSCSKRFPGVWDYRGRQSRMYPIWLPIHDIGKIGCRLKSPIRMESLQKRKWMWVSSIRLLEQR